MIWRDNPLLMHFWWRLLSPKRTLNPLWLPLVAQGALLWGGLKILELNLTGPRAFVLFTAIPCGIAATLSPMLVMGARLHRMRQSGVLQDLCVTPLLAREFLLGIFAPVWLGQMISWTVATGLICAEAVWFSSISPQGIVFSAALLLCYMAGQSAVASALVLFHWLRTGSTRLAVGLTAALLVVFPWACVGLAWVTVMIWPEVIEFRWGFLTAASALGTALVWQIHKPLHALHLLDSLCDRHLPLLLMPLERVGSASASPAFYPSGPHGAKDGSPG